ncbi:MAG: EAL domain-containing protein [Lachnospiraceae bacterium]|nr:EAL domain-containing protein [Lachnospiraceae bacterium]
MPENTDNLNNERDTQFRALLEDLVKAITTSSSRETLDVSSIYDIVGKLCRHFRAGRGVTTFYENEAAEKRGDGDLYEAYNNGNASDIDLTQRVVTGARTIVISQVFLENGAAPWTQLERERIDMIQKMIFSFVSRSRLQKIVEKLTFYDRDGYPNLPNFIRHLQIQSQNGGLKNHAALHFNLRHFSLVNQKLGRRTGDTVMKAYINQMAEFLDEEGMVARIGGDNFCALCPQDKLPRLIQMLKSSTIVYDEITGDKARVSATAGIYLIPDDFRCNDNSDIMDKIVPASILARTGGGDHIVYYDRRMDKNREHFMMVQQQFAQALARSEFKVFYQPKVSVYTGELVGAEALCRWFRDDQIIPPIRFIPALEQNTDICRLDFYMLEKVCRDLRRWQESGKHLVRVSVNLSRKHLLDDDLTEHLLEIIDKYRIPHRYIEFELTETTTDVAFTDLKHAVSALKTAGIAIAVDDFGVGFSSLNLVQDIPWDVLKVDKTFLPIEDDNVLSRRSIMFRHVVGMAKELGLECVAEGVETAHQVEILRDNNCDIAQGFWFDKPLPHDEFEKRLEQHFYHIDD